MSEKPLDTPQKTALFISAFLDELTTCGVMDVVISPGSRSTPLAMLAYESELKVHVDIDERGAAFFALGLAKASGKPVALICTSGTAVANYYPAILEAEVSRVPLIVLTGDRPPRLQNLGAPQTCDQLNVYGSHVKHFQNMSLPGADARDIASVRQIALEAFSRAVGAHTSRNNKDEAWFGCISDAGPVHLNFPFEEPLVPDLSVEGLFVSGRRDECLDISPEKSTSSSRRRSPLVLSTSYPDASLTREILTLLRTKRTLVICGEGTCVNDAERELIISWARAFDLPLLADPLSTLRSIDDLFVIDNYDTVFQSGQAPAPDLIIRFGRWPVSKACFACEALSAAFQVVVDVVETRDFNSATNLFVKCSPAAFVATLLVDASDEVFDEGAEIGKVSDAQKDYASSWQTANVRARDQLCRVNEVTEGFEGAYVKKLFDIAPEDSGIFSASSLSIRMIDSFYLKSSKHLSVFCNRGLNGIDGCLSSALGASYAFDQMTLVIGDLALMHDMNALALQHELLSDFPSSANHKEAACPSVIIVLMNNKGGGIFDMLPQRSEEAYFERLFLTPQSLDFELLAQSFSIPYQRAANVADFATSYQEFLGKPGIHLIEVPIEIEGLKERYGNFLS